MFGAISNYRYIMVDAAVLCQYNCEKTILKIWETIQIKRSLIYFDIGVLCDGTIYRYSVAEFKHSTFLS